MSCSAIQYINIINKTVSEFIYNRRKTTIQNAKQCNSTAVLLDAFNNQRHTVKSYNAQQKSFTN